MISDKVFKDSLEKIFKDRGCNEKFIKVKTYECIELEKLKIYSKDNILDLEEAITKKLINDKKSSKKILSEFEEHTEFIFKMKKKYPQYIPVYIHNGGSRSPREKVDQMRLGLCSGASDIFFPQLHTWVEMKKTKNYDHSDVQIAFEAMVKNAGYDYILGIGCEDALKKIEEVIKNKI